MVFIKNPHAFLDSLSVILLEDKENGLDNLSRSFYLLLSRYDLELSHSLKCVYFKYMFKSSMYGCKWHISNLNQSSKNSTTYWLTYNRVWSSLALETTGGQRLGCSESPLPFSLLLLPVGHPLILSTAGRLLPECREHGARNWCPNHQREKSWQPVCLEPEAVSVATLNWSIKISFPGHGPFTLGWRKTKVVPGMLKLCCPSLQAMASPASRNSFRKIIINTEYSLFPKGL